ncbi:S-adenosyl-L-methionine-dependent methyltransferase [Mycena epipterygia]|nr:S-adenosyl-L-methionine-dependent methyltransferase [Mycena epipterygia]
MESNPNSNTSTNLTKPNLAVPVVEAYNLWAKTYDSDGNVLQLLDDELLNEILPKLLSQPVETILDFGCGTGRNTEKILQYQNVGQVFGVDATPGMLLRAKSRLDDARLYLNQYDIIQDSPPWQSFLPPTVDTVISTLVIEHLPSLPAFFGLVHKLLRKGGWILVTNMHEDMGSRTGAGFVDEQGVRVTTDKFVHTVTEVKAAAIACGFELQGAPMIRRVEDEAHANELGRRANKWVGVNMLYGMVLVKTS